MNDFSENSSELDKYGVWVKKPSSADTEKETPEVEEPTVDASFITQSAATDLEIEQDLAEFDIDSLSETPVTEETVAEESSINEEVLDDSVMESISADDFTTEAVPEDFAAEEPVIEETSVNENELSLEDFAIDTINQDDGPMTFETEAAPEEPAPAQETETVAESTSTEEVSFEDGEIDLDAFMSDSPSTPADSTPDGDVDLSAFMDDSAAPAQDGEVDLSAFMGDGGDAPDFGNGDIDLDAFMGGEGFTSDKAEQEEIEDADPLDIDLDFEENDFELENAEATGDISGMEQSSSSLADMSETTEIEDFDALFDEIVDETPQTTAEAAAPAPKAEMPGNTEEIDLSDFGFDDDSDNQNPILDDGKPEPKKQGPVDYEMNVDDDDSSSGNTEIVETPEKNEDDGSDDIEVDISQDNEKSVQKEQETDLSSPDDSFDIDSIFDNIEDESGETVSFSGEKKPESLEENITTPSEEVTDSEPMFPESQEPDFGETFEEPEVTEETVIAEEASVLEESDAFEVPEVIEEPAFEETSVEEPVVDFASEETSDETEIDVPVFEEPVANEITEEPVAEESSIDLEDFMGEEGFTDGGPGVQGYDTIASSDTKEEEPAVETSEEPPVENSEEMSYNQEESEDKDISIDDFMGEEGFTDGGPGVQGYDTVASNDAQEEEPADEEETPEEIVMDNAFEEPVISDIMTEPDLTETEKESETMSDITEEPIIEGEPDYSNISAFADKKPEYDMTGVTLTLDDFANIKEYPDEPKMEAPAAEEPVAEETAVSEPEIQDQVDTYSVFIKTESSSGHAENTGAVAEEKDITTEETVAQEAAVSAEETMDSFDSSAILSQISTELASLRTEIKDLKSEFEEIKKNGIQTETSLYEENDSAAEEVTESVEIPEPAEDTGFFNETDEDDTIALSGDELSNILSTAEFTKTEENVDDGLKMDFENEELQEPVFDESEIDLSETETAEEESEISVPTVDDVLVEPSSSDLMDNTITTAEDGEDDIEEINEDDIPAPTLESLDIPPYEQEEELTEDNIEYLKEENTEDSDEENLETGISEQPVETVFNNWDAASEPEIEEPVIEEPVLEEPVIEEPVIEETAVSEEEIQTSSASDSNEIPASMKEEIKSVLSYMDQLLENLPEDKIAEFAQSEQFETYKKLFTELGLS
ncbi:hypothetical protein [Treponema sp.]|uniref:hypothetical protein n=1 Tax=Treponema sp. TaxID=166 RepID=UPI00298D8164|nr:hypothetical protein [Treponema sp.]MCQ2240606.1 hypothetical protein [Treponema sp.]